MKRQEFAERIRTVRKLAGMTPGQLAEVLASDAAWIGQEDRAGFWEEEGSAPDRADRGTRRTAEVLFVLAWDCLLDFGATDDMREQCRVAWSEAFYSEPLRPKKAL